MVESPRRAETWRHNQTNAPILMKPILLIKFNQLGFHPDVLKETEGDFPG